MHLLASQVALLIYLVPHALGRAIQWAPLSSLGEPTGFYEVSLFRRMAPPIRVTGPARPSSREGAQPRASSSDALGGIRNPITGETRRPTDPLTGDRIEGFSPMTGRATDSNAVDPFQASRPTAPPARSELLEGSQSPPPLDLSPPPPRRPLSRLSPAPLRFHPETPEAASLPPLGAR